MRRPHALLSLCVFTAVVGVYTWLALYHPMGYIWTTYEDLFGEWAQFWLFFAAFVVSARLLFVRTRYRVTFALLAVCCLYVAMEEISWGQRIVGFRSPEFFKEHNLQGETNLHNLLTGPFSTTLKAAITYLLAAGLVGYGVVFPILLRRKERLGVWLDAHGLAAPPGYVAPFLAGAAILEVGPFSFTEAEVAEVLVGFAMVITAIHYAFALKRRLHPHNVASWGTDEPAQLASRLGITTVLLLSMAANTTLAIYATPEGRRRIDNRIENGIEKFAGRYARYGQWDTSVELYRRLAKLRPHSLSILRKLANALRESGDEQSAAKHLRRALNVDHKKMEKDPYAASVRRSLVRTYRMLGEDANANQHLREALRIGVERIEKHPDGAKAAYSLGRTYELMGRHADALEQFERATTIKPTSKKFRKAYYRARRQQ